MVAATDSAATSPIDSQLRFPKAPTANVPDFDRRRPHRTPRFVASLLGLAAAVGWISAAVAQPAEIPAWLRPHVGDGEGQITRLVLERARALHRRKLGEGVIRNACYFAMDATRPNAGDRAGSGRRFYVICEGEHTFEAIPAGHGSGRDLGGFADFANGRQCVRNFGNALDSDLTAGGDYVTAETKTSFKGYYRVSAKHDVAFSRTFLQFDGEGETANARQRAIGGHAAVTLKGVCLRKEPGNPHADPKGFVPFGTLVDYAGGRSNGCTSWSPTDVPRILAMVRSNPTTLYIYPAAADVEAVAQAIRSGQSPERAGLYWNAACLREIRAPVWWSREPLEPLIAAYRRAHPAPPPRPTPICAR